MPLDDITDYLKQYPSIWFKTSDIARAIKRSNSSTIRLLWNLSRRKDVVHKLDIDYRIKYGRRRILYWRIKQ